MVKSGTFGLEKNSSVVISYSQRMQLLLFFDWTHFKIPLC